MVRCKRAGIKPVAVFDEEFLCSIYEKTCLDVEGVNRRGELFQVSARLLRPTVYDQRLDAELTMTDCSMAYLLPSKTALRPLQLRAR
jgi:hypothetical protein